MPAALLSVSLFPDDHRTLASIMEDWTVHRTSTVAGAIQLLRSRTLPVVVSEANLAPDSWKDLLTEVSALPKPPLFIVTSAQADDYLWVEALNLGAYDVLAKPFDATEVTRLLCLAAINWRSKHEPLLSRVAGA